MPPNRVDAQPVTLGYRAQRPMADEVGVNVPAYIQRGAVRTDNHLGRLDWFGSLVWFVSALEHEPGPLIGYSCRFPQIDAM